MSTLSGNPRRILMHPRFRSFYLPGALYFSAQGILVPILPLYAGAFEVSATGLIGMVLAAQSVGLLLGGRARRHADPAAGPASGAAAGCGRRGPGDCSLFWAPSIAVVIALQLLSGFFQALFTVAQHTSLAAMIAQDRRGRAIAIYGGTYRVGRLIGPLLGGALATVAGLRAPFVLYAGLCLAAFGMVFAFVSRERQVEAVPPELPSGSRLRGVIQTQHRMLLRGGLAYIGAMIVRSGWSAIIPLYGADVLGLQAAEIGLIVSWMSGLDMSLFYPTGMIMDRLGRKWAIVPSFSIQSIGLVLVAAATGPLGLLLAGLVIGFGNGLGAGTMMTLGADLAPPGAREEFLGVWRLIGDSGATVGPLAVGAVADILVLPAAALVVAGVGVLAFLTFALAVPRRCGGQSPARKRSAADASATKQDGSSAAPCVV